MICQGLDEDPIIRPWVWRITLYTPVRDSDSQYAATSIDRLNGLMQIKIPPRGKVINPWEEKKPIMD